MKKMYTENLVIGAGPAGLTCAMKVSEAGKKVILIEKENKIGGFGKTLEFKEDGLIFKTDIGPHRFFSKNKYLYEMISKLLKENWILVNRKTRQFIDGKFYDYPINFGQAIKNIGALKGAKIGLDYFSAIFKYKLLKKDIENFEDYIVANFGRELGEFNMLNYTEKIWGIPCKEIHPDWAKQRIKGLNLVSAVKNALLKSEGPKTLVDQFYYPKYGTGFLYDTMGGKIKEKGNEIYTNSYPEKILHDCRKIKEAEIIVNGKKEIFEIGNLIESIPLTDFLDLMDPKPPEEVLNASKKLRWRNQVYLFLTLDKERITDDNWIYFPNKEIPFGRVSEMKNFSEEMSPQDKTSLFIEFFVFENEDIWKMNKDELFTLALPYFEKLGFFKKEEVREHYLFKKEKVYPVYDLEYIKNLEIIKKYLDKFENLYYIGRPGRFNYTNQDHSLEMGLLAAKSIIENKKYEFDKIGKENEYFEEGPVVSN